MSLLANRQIDGYIGKKQGLYYFQCRGMDTKRPIHAMLVRLFLLDPNIRTNKTLIDYVDIKTYTINAVEASEWVYGILPEGVLQGTGIISGKNEVTLQAPNMTRQFTMKEFGCWFGANTLTVQFRELNNGRLQVPESLIDKSADNMLVLQRENIERGKRFLMPLLEMCRNQWIDIHYINSYLRLCGNPNEPYKMMMVAEMIVDKRGYQQRVDIGLVYFGDKRKSIYMYSPQGRVQLDTLRQAYEFLAK